jgi:hypothetical protein
MRHLSPEGNEPLYRAQALDASENLVREGMLEITGGDVYTLTEAGKRAVFS